MESGLRGITGLIKSTIPCRSWIKTYFNIMIIWYKCGFWNLNKLIILIAFFSLLGCFSARGVYAKKLSKVFFSWLRWSFWTVHFRFNAILCCHVNLSRFNFFCGIFFYRICDFFYNRLLEPPSLHFHISHLIINFFLS